MRRLAAVLVAVAAAAALTGCEDAAQRDARHVVEDYLGRRGGADAGDRVHCTHSARVVLDPVKTTRFLCTAQRAGGDCAWFEVDARGDGTASVRLVRRDAGCVLPAG